MFNGIRGTNYVREVDIGVALVCVVTVCNVGFGTSLFDGILWFSAFRPVKRYYLKIFFINPKQVL